jgi:hypothetical protein
VPRFDEIEAANRLSAYWDDVIRFRPAEPVRPAGVEPGDALAIRRFHAADDVQGATAAFAARLLEDLMQRPASIVAANGQMSTAALSARTPRFGPRKRAARFAGVLEIAAVLAMILVVGSLLLREKLPNDNGPDGIPGPGISSYAVATAIAEAGNDAYQETAQFGEFSGTVEMPASESPLFTTIGTVRIDPGSTFTMPENTRNLVFVDAGAGAYSVPGAQSEAGTLSRGDWKIFSAGATIANSGTSVLRFTNWTISPEGSWLGTDEPGATLTKIAGDSINAAIVGDVDASFFRTLLAQTEEVSRDAGPNGLAILVAETGEVSVQVYEGIGRLTRNITPSSEGEVVNRGQTVTLREGDSLVLQYGASYTATANSGETVLLGTSIDPIEGSGEGSVDETGSHAGTSREGVASFVDQVPGDGSETWAFVFQVSMEPGTSWDYEPGQAYFVFVNDGVATVSDPGTGANPGTLNAGGNIRVPSVVGLRVENAATVPLNLTVWRIGTRMAAQQDSAGITWVETGGGPIGDISGQNALLTFHRFSIDDKGETPFDTGQNGAAIVIVEQGAATIIPTSSNGASKGWIRREGENGEIASQQDAVFADMSNGQSQYLRTGDTMTFTNTVFNVTSPVESAIISVYVINTTSAAVPEEPTPVAQATSTPDPEPTMTPGSASNGRPDPADCTIEPRPVDELVALSESGLEPDFSNLAEPGEGPPASPEVVEEITETLNELAACMAKGDGPRIFAFYTDEMTAFGLDEDTIAPIVAGEDVTFFKNVRLPVIWDARQLEDGRVTARLDFNEELVLMTFVKEGDQWRIAFWNDQVAVGTPPAGA